MQDLFHMGLLVYLWCIWLFHLDSPCFRHKSNLPLTRTRKNNMQCCFNTHAHIQIFIKSCKKWAKKGSLEKDTHFHSSWQRWFSINDILIIQSYWLLVQVLPKSRKKQTKRRWTMWPVYSFPPPHLDWPVSLTCLVVVDLISAIITAVDKIPSDWCCLIFR